MTTGFYQSFENRHRGSEDSITQRLSIYQPAVDVVTSAFPSSKALDLGCGRGEWIQLLAEQGLDANGVDTDPDMLATCQQRNLEVKDQDALQYLKAQPDNHFSLVTAFHLVEHVEFAVLDTMVQEILRVLQPGGLMILETPNPENPLIGSCYFYTDPTHNKPLPPALLQFMADFAGFENSAVWRMHEAPDLRRSAPSLATVFKDSSPDYAVLAQKPGHAESSAQFQPVARQIHGITLDELATRYDNHHREVAEQIERKALAETTQLGHELSQHLARLVEDNKTLRQKDEEHQQQLAQLHSQVAHQRHLIEQHEQHLRTLAIVIRLLEPLRYRYVRERERLKQLRHSARTRLFYQWQLIKILRRLGMKNRANRMAEKLGLASTAPLSRDQQHLAPTGPLSPEQIQWSLIRSLSDQHAFDRPIAQTGDPLQVILDGHFSGSYSLAAVNRHLATALSDCEHTGVRLLPREGEPTDTIHSAPTSQLNRLTPLIGKASDTADVTIYHHFPVVENPPESHGLPILVFFWEESRIPPETIAQINTHYRGVLVTSWTVRKALIDCGCRRPIATIPLPMEDQGQQKPAPTGQGKSWRFLHVSSCFPRKGVDVLLDAFSILLARHRNIELVIKTFPNPHNDTEAQLQQRVPKDLRDRITLVQEDYDDSAMDELYRSSHAVVLPSRGEGLNLPAIEAVRHGLPVITTGYGAHTDFLAGDGVRFTNYRFAPSGTHLKTPGSLWVNPDRDDLIRQCEALMREDRDADYPETRQRVDERFFSAPSRALLRQAITRLKRFHETTKAPETAVTIMSTWGEACGIAEYSRYLATALMDQGAEVSVMAPTSLHSTDSAPLADRLQSVTVAWEQQSATPNDALATSDQAIWIQYHPGFFTLNDKVEAAIRQATEHQRLRVITLHATQPLLDLPAAIAAQAGKTLNQFYRVVVHTVTDLNNLKALGVTDNLMLLPQGVVSGEQTASDAGQRAPDAPFIVGCFGFLFPHKGVVELIDAFASFVRNNPDAQQVKLRLLTSVHPSPGSNHYRDVCEQRVAKHSLEDRVEFRTEFLEEAEVRSQLRECNLLVLPYSETPESSSAAVRTAVSVCPSVAVTPARIFNEVREATLTINGFGAEPIEQAITQTWKGSNHQQLADIHQARHKWLADHDWKEVGRRHRQLLEAGLTDLDWLKDGGA